MAFKIYGRLRCVLWKIKIVFLVWAALMTITFAFVFYATRATPPKYDPVKKTVAEMIGRYSDYDAGRRNAIQHIAAQMQHYPQAQNYTARYYNTSFDGGTKKFNYDRKTQQFFYGGGGCGCGGGYEHITAEMVQEVAAKRGTMDDFKKLGGVSYP